MDKTTRELGLSYDWALELHDGDSSALPVVNLAREHLGLDTKTLYVGFGNGRNAKPLLEEGFNLWACDVSATAVNKGRTGMPSHSHRIEQADFRDAFPHIPEFDAIVLSRALVEVSPERAVRNLGALVRRLRPEGLLIFQLPAIGTDLWPDWSGTRLDALGNLTVSYPLAAAEKVYLSFQGINSAFTSAGLNLSTGPIPVDLPRKAYPGGLVRNWLGIAQKTPTPPNDQLMPKSS